MSLSRALNRIAAWTVAGALSAPWVAAHAQQKPFAAEDAIALTRPITDRDPDVHSVEVRGHYADRGVKVRFHYWYEAPDRYQGLMTDDAEKATFFAAVGSRMIVYDPRQGELLVITDTLPGFFGIMRNNDVFFGYSYSGKNTDTSTPPESSALAVPFGSGVLIDLPSILGAPDFASRELRTSGGGEYRLTVISKTGTRLAATIDPSARIACTDLEIGAVEGKYFVEMHVNRTAVAPIPPIPSTPELRGSMAVREAPFPSDIPGWGRLLALQLLPLAAMSSDPLGLRRGVEFALGEKPNWDVLEANLKRDVSKLRQALPLP